MATTPEGLLVQLDVWRKEGLQRLTAFVDQQTASLAPLFQQAEADILELVAPFADKPRNKRRAGPKQKVMWVQIRELGERVCGD